LCNTVEGWVATLSTYELLERTGDAATLTLSDGMVPTGGIQRFVDGLPVEFHCHGMGTTDFSDLAGLSLSGLEESARSEGVWCLPTIYLPYSKLAAFEGLMQRFAVRNAQGLHRSVVGFAIEGPLLGAFGGTPEDGVWGPTKREWERLAMCGPMGLQYIVLSPDGLQPGSPLAPNGKDDYPSIEWIVQILLAHGVRPGFGHFMKSNAPLAAECIERALEAAQGAGARPFSGDVLTDHLFNDMPLNFKHAWRTDDRSRRELELREVDLPSWSLGNLEERCGPVPAALMRAAHAGKLTLCLNFDGEHVDIEVAKRAVELVGPRSVIAMTDRTDKPRLGSQKLTRRADNTLYYQSQGIVAAGSQHIDRQISNMRRAGIDEQSIWTMTTGTPARVLNLPTRDRDMAFLTCVDARGDRFFHNGARWTAPLRPSVLEAS
jgi:hypothetical protein